MSPIDIILYPPQAACLRVKDDSGVSLSCGGNMVDVSSSFTPDADEAVFAFMSASTMMVVGVNRLFHASCK